MKNRITSKIKKGYHLDLLISETIFWSIIRYSNGTFIFLKFIWFRIFVYWIFVKGYGFLPFAKNMGKNTGKNISENLSSKCS